MGLHPPPPAPALWPVSAEAAALTRRTVRYSGQGRLLKLLHYVDAPVDRRKWGMLATTVNAE